MSSKHSASTPLLRRVAQDHESQICFGAALICLGIGLCGLVLNMFFTLPASLDALFVTSVFFGLLGTVRAAHLQGEYSSGRLDLPREDSATHDRKNPFRCLVVPASFSPGYLLATQETNCLHPDRFNDV